MLIRCIRLKRIHVNFLFGLSLIVFVVIILSKFSGIEEKPSTYKLYSEKFENRTNVLEQILSDYENKIIPGLGDNGEPSFLDGADAREGEKALKTYALNNVLSDRMPLNRKLRDPRNKK